MTRKLFDRLFVIEFYRTYAGLFLFGGLLIVGICPPGQIITVNITIAQALSSGGLAGAGSCLAWTIYLGLVAAFLLKKAREVPSRFLQYSATAIPVKQRRKTWLRVILAMGLPVYGYGAGCVILGFRAGHLWVAASMAVFLLVSAFLLVLVADSSMVPAKRAGTQWQWPMLRFTEGNYTLLGLRYLMAEQKVALAVSKALSYVLITAMFFVFSDLHDHPDVAALILVAVVLAHSSLLRGQFRFEQGALAFMRNLPFQPLKRWLTAIGRIALVLLPEMVWIVGRYGLWSALHLVAFMMGFASLIYHLSFLVGNDEEFFVKVLFFLFFAMVILIPFGVAVYLGLLFFVICGLIYRFS